VSTGICISEGRSGAGVEQFSFAYLNNEIAMSKVYRRFDTGIQDLNEVQ
jgi:hypothetical protein